MFIRIAVGIRDHFEARVVEWAMAGTAVWWGWTVAQPGTAWINVDAWAGLLRINGDENAWGMACMTAGLFWIVALAVNGTFADTLYARYSPVVRGLAALGSAAFWFQVLMSVSAVQTSGSGIYPLPVALSCWCIINAWRDVGRGQVYGISRGS